MIQNTRPSVEELFHLLQKTSLPTVLVEGKDDIIFYRKIEEELREFGVDILPAGNKDAVLELKEKLSEVELDVEIVYVVDKDLWIHEEGEVSQIPEGVVTTDGYSIENDLYRDGDLESLLDHGELKIFSDERTLFVRWYALAMARQLSCSLSGFRDHPTKILDCPKYYAEQMELNEGEAYPEELAQTIGDNYSKYLRGKSLLALLQRQVSRKGRGVKFSNKQLMAICAAKQGPYYQRLASSISDALKKEDSDPMK